jgi:hypothetical protein
MERAWVAAQGRRIETESAPIVYVAQLLGVGADGERAIRWLILLMVLTCDPSRHRLDGCGLRLKGAAMIHRRFREWRIPQVQTTLMAGQSVDLSPWRISWILLKGTVTARRRKTRSPIR